MSIVMPTSFPLQDRVIVVIGGTTGLGFSAAKALIAAGACVVAVGRNPRSAAEAAGELGERARVVTGDASAPETAPGVIREAVETFGGFHGLYHVARRHAARCRGTP